jgi:hypothetical protein
MVRIAIAFSVLLGLAGIIIIASQAAGESSDTVRAAGLFIFSCGVLLAAFGLYQRARRSESAAASNAGTFSRKKKTDRLCSACNRNRAEVFCRVHILRLCLTCMNTHDDGRNCSYVPASRATAAYK